jgi:hypothetical protein
MVHSPKLDVINNDKHLIGISFTNGETIRFGSLDFIVNHFSCLSLFDEGNVSGTVFVRIAHSGSPSLHTILEDSIDEGDTTSSGGGSSCFPISRECNMVTLAVLITTTPSSEGTLMPLAIATVPLRTAIPQPDSELPPVQQQAHQEEQQVRARAWQVDAERRATQ